MCFAVCICASTCMCTGQVSQVSAAELCVLVSVSALMSCFQNITKENISGSLTDLIPSLAEGPRCK